MLNFVLCMYNLMITLSIYFIENKIWTFKNGIVSRRNWDFRIYKITLLSVESLELGLKYCIFSIQSII